MQLIKRAGILFVFVLLVCFTLSSPDLKAQEREVHAPAAYQLDADYSGNGFTIVQFRLDALSHFSYMLISAKKALVVDPGRDIAAYLEFAASRDLEWVGTFLTHVHSDFVAGHREMSQATGAPVYAGHKSGNLFPHIAVKEGDRIEVGEALVEIIETPGHTADSLCGLVYGKDSPEQGAYLFSGDTVFTGKVGRPDISQGEYPAAELASMLLDSWNNKLAKLAPGTFILPTHGAGSLCGIDLGVKLSSTIEHAQKSNPLLKLAGNRAAFLSKMLEGLQEPPAYFKEIAKINKIGPNLVDWQNPLTRKVLTLNGKLHNADVYIIDVREAEAYRQKHINGAINIGLHGLFERWTAGIVPFHARLILHGSEAELRQAAKRLKRVGYIADYLDVQQDFASFKTRQITAEELFKSMQKGRGPLIIDVRKAREVNESRIGPLLNIPLKELPKAAADKLYKNEEMVILCDSAYCSNIAAGIMERAGYTKHKILAGGIQAWKQAGFPLGRSDEKSVATKAGKEPEALKLPERLRVQALLELIKDFPDSYKIIDIRPAAQVAEYNPLNAEHVELEELLEGDNWLTGEKPLIIVDRDGTLAMMVAAIVSRRSMRRIKVLTGGLEAFWQTKEAGVIQKQNAAENPKPQGRITEPQDGSKTNPLEDKQKKGAGN